MKYSCVAFLVLFAFAACSGAQKTSPKPPSDPTLSIPAGAESWSQGALLLPEQSAMVAEARLDELLDAATRLKAWVFEEPRMLGENGAGTVRMLKVLWAGVTAQLGVDPLTPAAWTARGVDPTRPIYAASYRLGDDGERFVGAVDATLRSELGVPPGKPIGPALRDLVATAGQLPEGANSRVLRAVDGARPVAGVRIVIPTTTSDDFLATVTSFAEAFEFERLPPELATKLDVSPLGRVFWSDTSVPAFAVRIVDTHAVLDILFPAFLGGPKTATSSENDRTKVFEDLRYVLTEMPRGRPSAPRAPGDPAAALSFDQSQAADLVRLRGYQSALKALQVASTDRRDAMLLDGLLRAAAEAEAWEVAADELTGVTYSVHADPVGSRDVGRVSMTIFGRRDLPELPPVAAQPSLGIHNRSAAVAVTLAPMYQEAWRSWFLAGTPAELNDLEPELLKRATFVLPAIRNLTLILTAAGDKAALRELSQSLHDGVADLYGVRHVEIVVLDAAFGEGQPPRVLVEAVLDDEDTAKRAEAVRDYVLAATSHFLGGPRDLPAAPPPTSERTELVQIDGLPPVTYRLAKKGAAQVLVVGVGVDAALLERELDAVAGDPSDPSIIAARVEPVALLSWLRLGEQPFESLDLDILAQRLGTMLLTFRPQTVGESSGTTLEIVLQQPPAL